MLCPCCGQTMGRTDVVRLGEAMKLSRMERLLFARLSKRVGEWVPADALIDAAYGDDSEGGPLDIRRALSSSLRGLRDKLRPYGLAIDYVTGRGNGERRLIWIQERMKHAA